MIPSSSRDPAGDPPGDASAAPAPSPRTSLKIVSWNLLRRVGATLDDVVRLAEREQPDLFLMQEATSPFETLPARIGGHCAWVPLPGRIHGLAMWSPVPWPQSPTVTALPRGSLVQRVCQIVMIGDIGIANVHLSHGQRLNRRQLRGIAALLPPQAAVLGDYNLVGPAMLPGFRDVGPRRPTHMMGEIVPVRLDRCLVRGLVCTEARTLAKERSDHRPIVVRLTTGAAPHLPWRVKYREALAGRRRRAAEWAGFSR